MNALMQFIVFVALIVTCVSGRPTHAQSANPCELALVLAVDVSGSVNAMEYRLQMKGLAEAFLSSDIIHLIEQTSTRGLIHATVVQWSGEPHQSQIVGWTPLHDKNSVLAFANKITASKRAFINFSTAIGEVLAFSRELLTALPVQCRRRVIDISGDGPNNEGVDIAPAHALLMLDRVTINGLAVLGEEHSLGAYYRDNIIGGNGAFVMTANTFNDFPDAIRRKLLREIAPPITYAPSETVRHTYLENCLVVHNTC